MKKTSNLSELFDKLDELKTVFRYGEKLIPVIQGLVDFMRDTVPLLENINTSIAESTSKIPKATNQIHNITSATELATTEILDIIDIISNDISSANEKISTLIKSEKEKDELFLAMKALTNNPEAEKLLTRYQEINNANAVLLPLTELLETTRSNVYNITLSLQVQDITAQQLAAVNHLIESVQHKLSSLIIDFKVTNVSVLDSSTTIQVPLHTTFDPNARYSKSMEQQNIADALVKDQTSRASQDEIDKIFS